MPDTQGLYDRASRVQETTSFGIGKEGDYSYFDKSGFLNFRNYSTYDDSKVSGWKVHLSVAGADISRATDIVMDVYKQQGGVEFKVANPQTAESFANPSVSGRQAGKIFTLYDNSEKNFPRMIEEIERRFRAADIMPGAMVVEDAQIPGSQYASKRNENTPEGKQISAKEAHAINPDNSSNPYNQPDRLKDIDLSEFNGSETNKPTSSSLAPDAKEPIIFDSEWKVSRNGQTMEMDISGMKDRHSVALLKDFKDRGASSADITGGVNGEGYRISLSREDFNALKGVPAHMPEVPSGIGVLGKTAGNLGKAAGTALKFLGPVVAAATVIAATNSSEAAVANGSITKEQANISDNAAAKGAVIDIVSPVSIGANQQRDALVDMKLPQDVRAKLQAGDPASQIGRVRDSLPNRAEAGMSAEMQSLIGLNAQIKNNQGQQYADPKLREETAKLETQLYKKFDSMLQDPKHRQELERVTGVPMDPNEATTMESKAAQGPDPGNYKGSRRGQLKSAPDPEVPKDTAPAAAPASVTVATTERPRPSQSAVFTP